ncbi:MAG: ribosome maturation factor RimP [Firmicutes bacterium]|nr:ribosome maturation factor RimP [Bacillota bacterium]
MKKADLIRFVEEQLAPFAEEQRYEIVDVDYVKEGSDWYLRILADKEGGIGLDDCTAISRYIEPILDREDPVPDAYILEVSSPGIDRPLQKDKDFTRGLGKVMDVKLFKAPEDGIFAGQKEFTAMLVSCDHEAQTVELADEKENKQVFSRKDFAGIRPYIDF